MAFDPFSDAAGVAGAIAGGIGANNASKAQLAAANNANRMQRSQYLNSLYLNEVPRSLGYQASQDVGNFFGYDTPQYQDINSLAATMNPLTSKAVKKLLHQGYTVDQIGGMGTLSGLNATSIKRLTKAGLSLDQIHQLATRQQQQSAPGGQGTQGTHHENWDVLRNSPDYQFALQEGTRNTGNSFAAKGGAASGNALRALSEFNQGLASNQIDKFLQRRGVLMNSGNQASQNIQNSGEHFANAYGQGQQAAGDARASGILGVTGAIQGGLSALGGSFGGGGMMSNQMYGSGYGGGYGGYGTPGINPMSGPGWANNYNRNTGGGWM